MFMPDPGSEFFYPGSQITIKEFKYFKFLTQKIVFKLSEIRSEMFISDPGSGIFSTKIPDPGGQKSTLSRILIRNTHRRHLPMAELARTVPSLEKARLAMLLAWWVSSASRCP
jgi:hypothetical protein